jgi:hypothetical protein
MNLTKSESNGGHRDILDSKPKAEEELEIDPH